MVASTALVATALLPVVAEAAAEAVVEVEVAAVFERRVVGLTVEPKACITG